MVSNPGFETGDFTDWTLTAPSQGSIFGVLGDTAFAHSGLYAVRLGFGAEGVFDDSISQNISTVAGDHYVFSFWLKNEEGMNNEFYATFGRNTLLELQDSSPFDYTQYTYTVTATASSTALTFAGLNDSSFSYLDDVSVTAVPQAVPEASTTVSFGLLLALGLGGVMFAARKKKRTA